MERPDLDLDEWLKSNGLDDYADLVKVRLASDVKAAGPQKFATAKVASAPEAAVARPKRRSSVTFCGAFYVCCLPRKRCCRANDAAADYSDDEDQWSAKDVLRPSFTCDPFFYVPSVAFVKKWLGGLIGLVCMFLMTPWLAVGIIIRLILHGHELSTMEIFGGLAIFGCCALAVSASVGAAMGWDDATAPLHLPPPPPPKPKGRKSERKQGGDDKEKKGFKGRTKRRAERKKKREEAAAAKLAKKNAAPLLAPDWRFRFKSSRTGAATTRFLLGGKVPLRTWFVDEADWNAAVGAFVWQKVLEFEAFMGHLPLELYEEAEKIRLRSDSTPASFKARQRLAALGLVGLGPAGRTAVLDVAGKERWGGAAGSKEFYDAYEFILKLHNIKPFMVRPLPKPKEAPRVYPPGWRPGLPLEPMHTETLTRLSPQPYKHTVTWWPLPPVSIRGFARHLDTSLDRPPLGTSLDGLGAAACKPQPNSFGLAVVQGKGGATRNYVNFAACFEPLCAASSEGEAVREEGFLAADPNGNGLCSLAELETFILKYLTAKYPRVGKGYEMEEPGKDLFDAFRPCYIRAFTDAKDYKADTGEVIEGTKDATDDDFVSWEEFRFFCIYLIIYAAMYDAFAKIDGGGSGRDAGDDLRMELKEWLVGYKKVHRYGFARTALLQGLTKIEAKEIFETQIDDNGGGIVLLDEWCEWIKAGEIEAGTSVGELLNADEEGGVGENYKLAGPALILGKGVKGKQVSASSGSPLPPTSKACLPRLFLYGCLLEQLDDTPQKWRDTPRPPPKLKAPPKPAVPNLFGLAVGKGETGASEDFFMFAETFEAMCANTPEGEEMRKDGFIAADPNGNGFCSLAELETFVLKYLTAKYPRVGKREEALELGKDLFRFFRPCYMRAFADAKDFSEDTGEVIEGTKDATDDDFVSWPEFRIFCVYLIVYAAMYDGFAKIDGGGPGRDAGDDMRIEMNEWTQGYTTVTRHGFVRLAALADVSKKEAKEVFATQIDDNGGGIVLLDEWCEWLKKGEIDANTPIGLLLNASEGGKAAVEEDTAAQEARIHAMQEEKVKVEHAARLNKAKQFEAGERLALDKEEARADKIREFLQIFDEENARQDATWKNYERHATQPEKAKHKIDLAGRVEKLKKMKEELRVAKYKVQWKAEEHQRALGALKRARKPPKVDPTLGHKQVDKAKERARKFAKVIRAEKAAKAEELAKIHRQEEARNWAVRNNVNLVVVDVEVESSYGGEPITPGPSEELEMFNAPFKLYAADTPEGETLRKKDFKIYAGSSGLMSLAKLEGFILATLLQTYPKTGKGSPEVGRDLFDAYRPTYIRAFNDAKDFLADNGEVIAGTKSATADDYVSKEEFQIFNAMLLAYAAMYDAFSKIDGGGAGRAGDDRKIDPGEWKHGYLGATGYGFIAFKEMKDAASAKAMFDQMDDNGGGIVDLKEFCTFIKDAEVAAGTDLGKTLAAEEEASAVAARLALKKANATPTFDATPNSFGLAVGRGKWGATDDFFAFAATFEALCAETPEGEELRKAGFLAADPNGNGLCSLAELETFVLKYLMAKYPRTGKGKDLVELGKDLFSAFRPCYIRAFTDAKDYKADTGAVIAGTKDAKDDDFVSWEEFRLFCIYLIIYAAMYDAFAKIDGNLEGGGTGRDAGDNLRLELKDWLAGYKGVVCYGFVALKDLFDMPKKKVKALFMEKIDDNGGGIVLLDEWCEFIKAAEIAAGTLIGELLNADQDGGVGKKYALAGAAKVLAPMAETPKTAKKRPVSSRKSKTLLAEPPAKPPPTGPNSFGLQVGRGKAGATNDFLKFQAVFDPLCAETPEGEEMRKKGFLAADPNGNGLCSLAELETFVLKYLVANYPRVGRGNDLVELGKDLFSAFRPCYIRAFTDAKDYKANKGEVIEGTKDADEDDFVSVEEFRLFCVYLIAYGAMYDAFAKIDGKLEGGGSGRDAGDDLRMELKEWLAGYTSVVNYGFVALKDLDSFSKKDVKALFMEKIDDNGGGIVLLDEWCEFIKAAEVAAGTPVGLLLNADEEGGVGENFELAGPAQVLGKGVAGKGPAKPKKKKKKKQEPKDEPPPKLNAEPNSFGLAVARGKWGASKDFFMFAETFEPLCAETPEGEELRKTGFLAADPNGNGLCSLAELETFVLKYLVAKYPRFGRGLDIFEPGKDLFDAYRPCYMRAFTDAKDYKANDGEIIEGTKDADEDDFVSWEEFRLFCVYLIVYGAMYDSFAKIDGGGVGRYFNDDRRMELSEWMQGYKKVTNHGFVALKDLGSMTKDELKVIFLEQIDDNGGGIVLLDEWCEWLKAAEVKAGTAVGELLNADEEGGIGENYQLAGPAQVLGNGTKGKLPVPTSSPKKPRAARKEEPPPKLEAAPNSFGLAVAKGKKWGATKDLFMFMSVFEPLTAETPDGDELRKAGFIAADPNGNGLCSLAELETFVLKYLVAKFPRVGKGKDMMEPGKDLFSAFRPCYIRAFTDAKDYKTDTGVVIGGTEDATDDDFVSVEEFRFFCVYLIVYGAMYDAFAKIDGNLEGGASGRDAGDDLRMELKEWLAGYKGVTNHGFVALDNLRYLTKKEAKEVFVTQIDDNGGGIVLLDEWCEFIKKAEIEANTPVGELLNADEAGGVGGAEVAMKAVKIANARKKRDEKPPRLEATPNSFGLAVAKGKKWGATKDFFFFADTFEPLCAETPEGEELRKEGFIAADPNGNGLCSLAELETFVLKYLVAKYPRVGRGKNLVELGKDLFDAFRPCYIRAFTDAKDYKANDGEVIAGTEDADDDDFVSWEEFRLFCVYLIVYAAMYDAFAKIDGNLEGGGSGRDAGDDLRMELDEWMKGYKEVTNHGFVALKDLGEMSRKEIKVIFIDKIDDNGGGIVLFDEWCEFIKAAEVAAGTPVGLLLSADEDGGVGENYELAGPAQVLGKGVKGKPGAPIQPKKKKMRPKKKEEPPPKLEAAPNSFGLAVAKGKKWGATKDFFMFADTFEALTAETPEGEELRKAGFIAADPNGNGLCSLAELETFVLKYLVAKYPRVGKGYEMEEPGKDLFKAFRPCYMRAFADAKDYKADTGEIIEGTKDATDDDFVSWEEFRIFCVYLVVYAAMYDAFAKIDGALEGGGSGRDAGDDLRMELKEWEAGYKGVTNHGFVALDNLRNLTKKEVKVVFMEQIDDNGGGIVLLDEWCEWIKAGEIEAGTPVGELLNADEEGGVGNNYKLAGAAKILGKGVKGKKGSSPLLNVSNEKRVKLKPKKPFEEVEAPIILEDLPPETNSFGLIVSRGKMGVSEDFIRFAAVFEPLTSETPEGDALREVGFLDADPNGNGLCSLAELETFVLKALVKKHPKIGSGYSMEEPGKNLFDAFRPCYMRAFVDAKDYKADTGEIIEGTGDATDDDFVSVEEFRIFCVYLIVYAAMYDAFAKIDGIAHEQPKESAMSPTQRGRKSLKSQKTADLGALPKLDQGPSKWAPKRSGGSNRDAKDDKRIEEAEWLLGYTMVALHGFVALQPLDAMNRQDARAVFLEQIDDNGGGIVLLDEWCEWIKKTEIDASTPIGLLLAADEDGGVGGDKYAMAAAKQAFKNKKRDEKPPRLEAVPNSFGLAVGKGNKWGATKDYFRFAAVFEPLCHENPEGEELRKEGFIAADPNGNGLCSLSELETFVLKALTSKYKKEGKGNDLIEPGKDLFKAFRPCYMRAFVDAKDYKADTGEIIAGTEDATDDDFVSWEEFRIFCVYLIVYAAMYDAFAKIDGNLEGGGSGRDAGDDLRMELDEWMKGYKGVTNHGFVALKDLGEMSRKEIKVIFMEQIDDNGGGIVLLDEWCEWIKKAEIKAKTPVGELLNADEDGGVGSDKYAMAAVKKANAKKKRDEPPPKLMAVPNSFGLSVAKGNKWGATKDFFQFAAVFEPLCADTPEGEELRKAGFIAADPNGNGLCSLAELETFVLKYLVAKYPRVGKGDDVVELGKNLFKEFRPCYMRAFTDAKDYAADSGEVIEGTKGATDDDFVSWEEFRLFNVYLIVYGAMFDAFAKIDGGGSGRDANDDLRIDLDEWMKGYKGVTNHGFVALDNLRDLPRKELKAIFMEKIDNNGGGIVLLDEWCEWIKRAEVKAGTLVGKLLDADEAGGVGENYSLQAMHSTPGKKMQKRPTTSGQVVSRPLQEGEFVEWRGEDEDLPRGTLGVVQTLFGDGDVEVVFKGAAEGKAYTLAEARLLVVPTLHAGDLVEWLSEDEDLPRGTMGVVVATFSDGDVEAVFGAKEKGRKLYTFALNRLLLVKLKVPEAKVPSEPRQYVEPNNFGMAVGKGKQGASKKFFMFQAVFEPLCSEKYRGEKMRREAYLTADPNGNGLCSLAELETFVLKYLLTKYPRTGKGNGMVEPGQDLFKAFRPCYMRAFADAKDYKANDGEVIKGTDDADDDDFVSVEEFRLFCVYLIVYAAMYDAFAKIDGGGSGRDAGDDLRIELREWLQNDAFKTISNYGFVALENVSTLTKKQATKLFMEKIDDNGGGIVLLDEWCEFIKAAEVAAGTPVGLLLSADEGGGAGENYELAGPAQVLGKGVKGKPGAPVATKPKKIKKKEEYEPPPKLEAAPNSFGLAVAKGKKWGATKDFFMFAETFEALCAETPEGEQLRIEGFLAADPNGNGLCSLAELETFVLKSLTTKYKKTGKGLKMEEPGKDLFKAFRPCYIRAFTDAKDFKADTGAVIAGTKDAKDDDFVSWEEFRFFCIYLIVYAAMYDAFAKIDGGGSGRDAGDDLRIELDEWLKGYTFVANHGFIALRDLGSKKDAKAIFMEQIDDNGGGIVLLDEWCEFIKAAEVAAGTTVGLLLSADEGGGVGENYELAGPALVLGKCVKGKQPMAEATVETKKQKSGWLW